MFCAVAFALVFLAATAARADVQITLPLQGFYHAGRYMPVQVTAENTWNKSAINLELYSSGAVSTQLLFSNDSIQGIAPFLPFDARAQRVDWKSSGHRGEGPLLHLIAPEQKIVGYTTADPDFARELFPGQQVLPIRLDGARPLAGPAAAWDTLDAVILDAPSLDGFDEGKLRGLVADGVVFAVKSQAEPFARWPWKRMGDYWVLRFDPAGPRTVGYSESVYAPVTSWSPGWPAVFRVRAVLVAVIFAILTLALVLWRPRGLAILAVLLSAAAVVALSAWWWALMPVQQRGGEIMIASPQLTQIDDWTYQTSGYHFHGLMHWADICRPVYESRDQLDASHTKLQCYSDGSPFQFEHELNAGAKLVFLTRSCGPHAPTVTPTQPFTSGLQSLAKQLYVVPDDLQPIGEFPPIPSANGYYARIEAWNTIVLARK